MENRYLTADDYVNKNINVSNLYEDSWQENSTALLLSPREVDKTSFAIDIAISLTSKGEKVFYLTAQRIAKSNLSKLKGNRNLYVHTPEFSKDENDLTDYADIVIADIQEAIAVTGARIFIIDSLSRIAALSFGKNASANYIMKRLIALQVCHNVSLLVMAHESTKAANRALINLADSQIEIPTAASEEEVKSEIPIEPAAQIESDPETKSYPQIEPNSQIKLNTQIESDPLKESDPKKTAQYTLGGNIEEMRQELIKSLNEGYMVIDENGQSMKFRDWRGRLDFLSTQLFHDWLNKTAPQQSDY